jgi:hypothetical protein
MFDLILVLVFLVVAIFGGVLGRVILSRASVKHSPFHRKIIAAIGIGVGLAGGISTMIFISVLTIVSGESLALTRLFAAFIEGFVPMAAGVLIGFVAIGARLT